MDILYNKLVLFLEVQRHSQMLLKILKSKLNSKYICYEILELYLMQKIIPNDTPLRVIIKNNLVKYLYFIQEIWDSNTCVIAARNGKLECLKYVHENGCSWNKDTCTIAAEAGNLECLKYAHENGCPWDKYTCKHAARYNNLECLKYAHENGCDWNVYTCACAAKNGNLEVLM